MAISLILQKVHSLALPLPNKYFKVNLESFPCSCRPKLWNSVVFTIIFFFYKHLVRLLPTCLHL
jgi:hypothetical protein